MKKVWHRKLSTWFVSLNQRERFFVGLLGSVLLVFLLALPIVKIRELLEDNARLAASRAANACA